jgi:hypothetical protein
MYLRYYMEMNKMKIKKIEYYFNILDRQREESKEKNGIILAEISNAGIRVILDDNSVLESELGLDKHFNKNLNIKEDTIFIEEEEKSELFSKKINNFEKIYEKLCSILFSIIVRESYSITVTRVEGVINDFNGFGE